MAQGCNVQPKQPGGYWNILFLGLLIVIALWLPRIGIAASNPIVLISRHDLGYHKEFVDYFRQTINQILPDRKLVEIDINNGDVFEQIATTPNPAIIVTVGTRAAKQVENYNSTVPVLHTLITRHSYQQLNHNLSCVHSAVYLDQPVERLLALITATLPDYKQIGILLGTTTELQRDELKEAARRYSFQINAKSIDSGATLNDVLGTVLASSQVLLTLPDPTVVNSNTAKTLIMSAYLRQVPIIGYSKAMVKAGALMATYSELEQLGIQSAAVTTQMIDLDCKANINPVYPEEFSVAVNYQVARVLGLQIPEQESLKKRMKQLQVTK